MIAKLSMVLVRNTFFLVLIILIRLLFWSSGALH